MTPANDNRQAERPAEFDARVMAERPFLKKVVRKHEIIDQDREDMVQDTIALALKRWESFDVSSNFRSWLSYLMREAAAKKYKNPKKSHVAFAVFEPLPEYVAVAATQEGAASARSCLDALSDSQGDNALVRLAAGETLEEIGETLGVSKQRVFQITNVARKKFARRIGWKVAA